MNTISKLFTAAIFMCGMLAFNSCSEELNVGTVNEKNYSNIGKLTAFLRDAQTGKGENIVELRTQPHQTSIYVGLTNLPKKGVDLEVVYDAAYLDTYNQIHGTDFALFPQGQVMIGNDGKIVMAPDETRSMAIDLKISPAEGLEDGKTYVLPLLVKSTTEGVQVSSTESHSIYLVKNFHSESDCDKGPDAVKNFLYFEVNDTNPLNALEFVREDGKLFFDYVVLFAANINYNAETGRVYVWNNPNVQYLLDNNEKFLQPLRKRGIKVILGILGNHDAAGVAQLSELGAKQFAQELAAYCKSYNLDGVNFDDEYSEKPDLSNPLFAPRSFEAGSRLLFETKKAMPDKLVTVYTLGYLGPNNPSVDGFKPGEFVDLIVADYALAARPMEGMTLKQCAGMSVELRRGTGSTAEWAAQEVKEQGYGYYMWFALDPSNFDASTRKFQSVCRGLYDGMELKKPEFYYKKNDLTRYPYQ